MGATVRAYASYDHHRSSSSSNHRRRHDDDIDQLHRLRLLRLSVGLFTAELHKRNLSMKQEDLFMRAFTHFPLMECLCVCVGVCSANGTFLAFSSPNRRRRRRRRGQRRLRNSCFFSHFSSSQFFFSSPSLSPVPFPFQVALALASDAQTCDYGECREVECAGVRCANIRNNVRGLSLSLYHNNHLYKMKLLRHRHRTI